LNLFIKYKFEGRDAASHLVRRPHGRHRRPVGLDCADAPAPDHPTVDSVVRLISPFPPAEVRERIAGGAKRKPLLGHWGFARPYQAKVLTGLFMLAVGLGLAIGVLRDTASRTESRTDR
jgi:hypothetical protein